MKNPKIAGPAILAWAVEGCQLWQEYNLQVPAGIERATNEYQDDMDPLKDFFDDRCVFYPDAKVPVIHT